MKILFYGIEENHGKGEFCERRIFDYYTVCCFETPFLYESDGEIKEGSTGDMLIMEPGQVVYHGPRKSSGSGFVNDWVYIYGDDFGELLNKYRLPLNTPFFAGKQNYLRSYIEKIKKEFVGMADGAEDKINYITGEWVIDTYRSYKKGEVTQTPFNRIEFARQEFLQSPEKQWTLEKMAALCGYSASRFSALYKSKYGSTPKADLLFARIALSKQMLKYSNASVTEISEACGFGTIYFFSKYFKSCTGSSPREYAQGFKNSIGKT